MDVELDDGAVVHFAGWDFAIPLHQECDADAAFPRLRLEAEQGAIAACGLRRGAAVVAEEKG